MTAAASPFGRLLLASSLAHGVLLAWPGAAPPSAPPPASAIEVALGAAPAPARAAHRVAPAAPRAPTPAPARETATTPAADPAPDAAGDAAPAPAQPAAGPSAGTQAAAESGAAAASELAPDQLPYARHAPRPPYPDTARQQARQGKVRVRVLIAVDGTVAAVDLLASSGDASLDRAALETLPRWRFSPARRDGQAISAWVVVPVVFNLR